MPLFKVLMKCDLENIQKLFFQDTTRHFFEIECTSCHEANPNPISIKKSDLKERQKGRGNCHLE